MFRLYKKDDSGQVRAYYEVWAEPARRRIVEHWGAVGDPGETEVHRIWFFGSLETQFDKIMGPARAQGFEALPRGAFQVVTLRATPPTNEDISDEADGFAERVNEILGWTGLGACETASVHGGCFEVHCDTVDGELCRQVLLEALQSDPDFEGYIFEFVDAEA